MNNVRMQEMLDTMEAMDVSPFRQSNGTYLLPCYFSVADLSGCDYCDAELEKWIWSIGKNKNTGEIRAALDGRFYCNSEWECVWLR